MAKTCAFPLLTGDLWPLRSNLGTRKQVPPQSGCSSLKSRVTSARNSASTGEIQRPKARQPTRHGARRSSTPPTATSVPGIWESRSKTPRGPWFQRIGGPLPLLGSSEPPAASERVRGSSAGTPRTATRAALRHTPRRLGFGRNNPMAASSPGAMSRPKARLCCTTPARPRSDWTAIFPGPMWRPETRCPPTNGPRSSTLGRPANPRSTSTESWTESPGLHRLH